jgi:hypothetical protein
MVGRHSAVASLGHAQKQSLGRLDSRVHRGVASSACEGAGARQGGGDFRHPVQAHEHFDDGRVLLDENFASCGLGNPLQYCERKNVLVFLAQRFGFAEQLRGILGERRHGAREARDECVGDPTPRPRGDDQDH